MTLIKVNPASVATYLEQAQTYFQAIAKALKDNVDDLVAIDYNGPRAAAFKTTIGTIAVEFGTALHADLAAMSAAVTTATDNVARTLGSSIQPFVLDTIPLELPKVDTADFVNVDTTALEGGKEIVTRQFDQLRAQLLGHQEALAATDWAGEAKNALVSIVTSRTTTATERCDEAQCQILEAITEQLESVLLADSSVSASG